MDAVSSSQAAPEVALRVETPVVQDSSASQASSAVVNTEHAPSVESNGSAASVANTQPVAVVDKDHADDKAADLPDSAQGATSPSEIASSAATTEAPAQVADESSSVQSSHSALIASGNEAPSSTPLPLQSAESSNVPAQQPASEEPSLNVLLDALAYDLARQISHVCL